MRIDIQCKRKHHKLFMFLGLPCIFSKFSVICIMVIAMAIDAKKVSMCCINYLKSIIYFYADILGSMSSRTLQAMHCFFCD